MAFWNAKRLFSVRLYGVAARARRALGGGQRDGAALDRLVRTAERLDYGGRGDAEPGLRYSARRRKAGPAGNCAGPPPGNALGRMCEKRKGV